MTDEMAVSLETVFDAIPVGLGIVDSSRRIVLMNQAFRESLGLPSDSFPPGTPVEAAVRASALRGVYGPGDPDAQVRAIMAADRSQPGLLRRRTFSGRAHDLYNTPLPGGAYAVTAVETTGLVTARTDAEAALAQTATALTALRIGLAIFDPMRRLLLSNPRFSALLALPPDRPVPGSSFDVMLALMQTREEFAGPDGAAFLASLRDAAFGPARTIRRRHTDGRSIDVMLDALPDGGCTIAVSDITPQAQAEDDASRRARLLDLVLLNVPHGICVYGADHRVAMFNDAYAKVMDGAPVQVGERLADVIRRRAKIGEYGPGDPEPLAARHLSYDIARPQMRRRMRPNGTAIDVRTAPMPDGGHISVVTDISALVQAEDALRQRAADMSTMLDNIRLGVMLYGPDRRLVASNPVAADLLALPADVLTPGRTEVEVLAELSRIGHFGPSDGLAPAARRMLDLDRSVPFGREVTALSGRVLYAQSNPAPGGGWITTFTDVTEMRQAEQELRRAKERAEAANLAKSRFLATMSHELRTPLNAIIGFSDALARENGDVPAELVSEYSGQINDAGKKLLSLINIILDVARIESGRFEATGESSSGATIDLGKVIRAAVRLADAAARAGDVTVVINVPEALPQLYADERQFVQAVSQLLSNAIKFTEAGGQVAIEAGSTAEADLYVTVADTGIGIPDSDLERVFEPFTQLDNALSRRYPGAGLGLFMARAIVAAHGGELLLASRPGQGTTARITLPKARLACQPAS
jgi:signal transduction histidine kinase